MSYRTLLATASVSATLSLLAAAPAQAVFFHIGSGSIDGSLCVGLDCVASPSFGFDTVILRENNLRILFDDTSTAASFPSTDWRLIANDSANGGAGKFVIEDASAGRNVFTVSANARSNALFVDSQGDVGIGTSTPATDIDIKVGDTPTVRLQQDGSSGFAPQTWDMAGNETSFFIRDATSGSTLPFRIMGGGAPSSALVIDDTGNIGMGLTSPSAALHIVENGVIEVKLDNTSGGAVQVWKMSHTGSDFRILNQDTAGTTEFNLDQNGNLSVLGTITSGGTTLNVPDYVFADDYTLMPLEDVEKFIVENKHLPKIPSAGHINANGLNVTEMQMALLEKVEELTLYTLEQQRIIDTLAKQVDALSAD